MTPSRGVRALVLVLAASACAEPKRPVDDDFDRKPWEAQKALLPPYPKQSDLAPIYASPALPFRFFVDTRSVVVTQTGVVRFTLFARSVSGATNVSYEGIRCSNLERKAYAFADPDGTWAEARNSAWTQIIRIQTNQYSALADDFFCVGGVVVKTAEDAVRALARGNQP